MAGQTVTIFASVAVTALAVTTTARAYEFGFPGSVQSAGIVIGASAEAPPPGLYGFNQVFTYQARIVGPGAPTVNGAQVSSKSDSASAGLLWVPGWSFLGASYDVVGVVPFTSTTVGSPIDFAPAGMQNAFLANELSWRLGETGFFIKTGLGLYVPTGTQQGPAGLSNVGVPWWTFEPSLVLSYVKDGWNLTANLFEEINTANRLTNYRTGNVLHAEFTATKSFDKWTLGPVAYYVGQVTDDRSSAFYNGAINVNRYNVWAVGGLVGYDFGPASINVWGLKEISASASGGRAGSPGVDTATITKGFAIFAQLNYRIWAPEEPAARSIPYVRK
ncbi:transporter [Bradyrhizobium sp. WD16]|uniref:SphA family protein n=1 Tax=Bradyrhizobium sp. WD16 TaxID=1521768 RepID=UPI0020A3713F|nr:transporter [Bradyrhizobium sp. WD16]